MLLSVIAVIAVIRDHGNRGQCGLARPRVLAGVNPVWVIVSREPSIEPCGATGNVRVDA